MILLTTMQAVIPYTSTSGKLSTVFPTMNYYSKCGRLESPATSGTGSKITWLGETNVSPSMDAPLPSFQSFQVSLRVAYLDHSCLSSTSMIFHSIYWRQVSFSLLTIQNATSKFLLLLISTFYNKILNNFQLGVVIGNCLSMNTSASYYVLMLSMGSVPFIIRSPVHY